MSFEKPSVLLNRYGLSARKRFGQHFLHAEHVHRAIVEAAHISPKDHVIEIGCGLGSLTNHLLATSASVHGIERDRDLCPVLRGELGHYGNFTLHEADAVQFDYGELWRTHGIKPIVVGNLPYNLTGPLLFALLAHHNATSTWVVMIQKEVADRLCAQPGNRTYGGVTVALSRVRRLTRVCVVGRGAFTPPPGVDSAIVCLTPLPQPRGEVHDEQQFLRLVRGAFQQRRKTIANALSSLADRTTALSWCITAGVNPQLRPEQLPPESFAALANAAYTLPHQQNLS